MELNPDDYMDVASHKDIFRQMSEDFGLLPLLSDDLMYRDESSTDVAVEDDRLRHNNLLNEFLSRDNRIKLEPPSPTPSSNGSHGESFSDSWASVLNIPTSSSSESSSNVLEWRTPETPPISPQDQSPSVSPELKYIAPSEEHVTTAGQLQPSSPSTVTTGSICPRFQAVTVTSNGTPAKFGAGMLTRNDLLSLASQGILQFGAALPPPPPQTNLKTPVPRPMTSTTTVVPAKRPVQPVSHTFKPEVDPRALKRQQRMIKNRESACLSRKKKREYVQNLEALLKNVTVENERLRFDNEQLRRRLQNYEKLKQNSGLSLSSSTKKATALVAVVFMVSLNLGPLRCFLFLNSGIFMTSHRQVKPIETSMTSTRHGRSLLWVADVEPDYRYDGGNGTATRMNVSDDPVVAASANESIGTADPHTCPMYINRTESMRLDSELRGWIFGGGSKRSSVPPNDRPSPVLPLPMKLKFEKNLPPLPRHKKYLEREPLPDGKHFQLKANVHELQIYQGLPASYDEFLKAIKHREDTFYVVSFTGDHLLVPARAHNKTRRPLMSLVLPALSLNDSMKVPAHHVVMMQIECEVVNTKLVNVKDSYMPSHGRQRPDRHENGPEPRRRAVPSTVAAETPRGAKRPRTKRSEIAN